MTTTIATACLAAFLTLAAAGAPAQPAAGDARLQQLEDREAIRVLFNDYGRLIDERNFAAFAELFAANSEYVAGPNVAKGPAAIRAQLEGAIGSNTMGIGSPNFHIFFNESIRVEGDRATATSKGAFVAPDEKGRPQIIILATYDDVLTREGGRWKFQRRVVRGDLPAPRAR
jgi:ketosteroid isomerase-like protein